ncbi:MAG: bifunctional phosphoglucose/phosphomannose isomerase [Candidatus Omnitrophica bacterium]|nr:bifunctional phosphoglucose/phosphomannose isomerase [Candidatus Omnitrophota bacterium]
MLDLIKKFDSADMLTMLQNFPQQCRDAFMLGKGIELPSSYHQFNNIVFSGMGGSAIGGDIIRTYCLYKLNLPIFVFRNYNLPSFINEDTLFFACSYSGNTEETIASFQEARRKKAKIVVISSGGELITLAQRKNIPFIKIPSGYPPRQSLGYFVFVPLYLLQKIKILNNLEPELEETFYLLERMRDKKLSPEIKKENIAFDTALLMLNRFPVIYSQIDYLDVVSMRWRAQLAENSKVLSSINFLPELNHNEIVGWRFPKSVLKNFIIFLLRDNTEQARIRLRIEITKELLKKDGFLIKEVRAEGRSLMARILSLIYIGDFVSYYLAILNQIDPTPVKPIAYLKKRLAKISHKGK